VLKNKIVSEKYLNSLQLINDIKDNYNSEKPYPNTIIPNFFDEKFLNDIASEFPDLSRLNDIKSYNNKNEIKLASNDFGKFPDKIKEMFNYLNSEEFLKFLQFVTSIKEKLISDKDLNGGGLHEIKRGGLLKVHTDFNRHPTLPLDRRLNILIYLNKNWKNEYGGELQLWDRDMKNCVRKIPPLFNTLVIFNTTDFSNHGHPDPLMCPSDKSRRSLATYYYSDGRPENEVLINKKNRTEFKDREGFNNETSQKNETIKNFLRKFKLYKNLKNLEKRYFRSGNNKNK
tara:strand:+ start:1048 stop:1905 length:858 start_codon:yes stop_codon:yes gene_type:complete